jgi:hypothetical protein
LPFTENTSAQAAACPKLTDSRQLVPTRKSRRQRGASSRRRLTPPSPPHCVCIPNPHLPLFPTLIESPPLPLSLNAKQSRLSISTVGCPATVFAAPEQIVAEEENQEQEGPKRNSVENSSSLLKRLGSFLFFFEITSGWVHNCRL